MFQDSAQQDRDFQIYTVRVPLALHRAIRETAQRHFEPAAVLVRRLLQQGLDAELRGGAK